MAEWTSERDTQVREMISFGYSYTMIGERLGVTRNAIAGRVNRLGWSVRSMAGRQPTKPPKPPKPIPAPPVAFTAIGVTLVDLERHQCRYAIGEDDGIHLFCAATTTEGASYCAEHVKISYVKGRR